MRSNSLAQCAGSGTAMAAFTWLCWFMMMCSTGKVEHLDGDFMLVQRADVSW